MKPIKKAKYTPGPWNLIAAAPDMKEYIKKQPCTCPDTWENPNHLTICERGEILAKAEGRE